MATSSDYTFNLERDQLINLSLADVGAIAPGGTPTDQQRTHAVAILETLVKSIDADGIFLWRTTRRELDVSASDGDYSLAADVIAIDEPANFRLDGEDTRTVVKPMTRDEFMALSDRTTEGRPTRYYLERTLTAATLYLYPVPDSDGTLEYAAVLTSRDMDSGSVTPDFPSKWLQTLRWGLSMNLCFPYGQSKLAGAFRELYEAEKAKVVNDDNEHGDIQFMPYGDSYGGRY